MKPLIASAFFGILCVSCGLFSPHDEGFSGYKVVEEAELFVIDLDGKNLKKIMDGLSPVLFPHSNSLIARHGEALYSINLDGSNKKRRAAVKGLGFLEDVPMSISADEKYVAYTSRDNGFVRNVFLLDLTNNSTSNITNSESYEYNPVFWIHNNEIFYDETVYEPGLVGAKIQSRGISSISNTGIGYKQIIHDSTGGFNPILFTANGDHLITFKYARDRGFYIILIDLLNNIGNKDSLFIGNVRVFDGPAISQDNKLYYSANNMDIYRLDPFTGAQEKIYEGYIGDWYSFSKDFKRVVTVYDSLRLSDSFKIIDFETGKTLSTYCTDKGYLGKPLFSQNDSLVVFFTMFYEEYD